MVFKNLDNREKAYGTLGLFFIVALFFWWLSDPFSLWSSTANPWLALLFSIILNPAYAVLIYWLFKEYSIRGLISGILISIAFDIISLTHSIGLLGNLPTGATSIPLYGYPDTLIYKIILPFIGDGYGAFILYVIIPTLLIYLSLRIIRKSASWNRIFKEGI